METPVEPTFKPSQPTLRMIRKGLLDAVVGWPITQFETARETAMKGYTTFAPRSPSNNFQPTLTPPPDSILYHVGDLWDGYFFTAMVYWGLTFPTLLLPEKFLYHGKSKFSPENIRLAIAFSMVVAGIIIVEANDPKDIPAGVIGASLFVITHLSNEKVSQFTKKVSKEAEEALPLIAKKIASLPQKFDQLTEKLYEKLGVKN